MSKPIQRLDTLVADDLGLTLASIAMILKHVTRFPKMIDGFVFAYTDAELVHYDTAMTWHYVNGMRVRNPRFQLHPVVAERLNKRKYKRWYVMGDGHLYPLQTAKTEDLYDQFQFIADTCPTYRTTTVLTEECLFIRKKPLLFHRLPKPTWGSLIGEHINVKRGVV